MYHTHMGYVNKIVKMLEEIRGLELGMRNENMPKWLLAGVYA